MRVVFLDIDGVMNSFASAKRFGSYQTFAPESVEALNHILAETGAEIVVSSTWRLSRSIGDLTGVLWGQGVKCRPVIGMTPQLVDRVTSSADVVLWRSKERGLEITAWLEKFGANVESYVVLDDDSDAGVGHDGCFVQTEFEVGLTTADAQRAIAILKETRP